MFQSSLTRLSIAALLVGMMGGCNPYVWSGAAVATVPQLTTGRNAFYHMNKAFGKSCADSTYFDRPLHCVNERD
ncbi:MAG: hypothetical protein NXI18_03655 [Alphaproteobacteria bacterium]|nr:hypothetical protein [Alphaproteobacteria bacterium]